MLKRVGYAAAFAFAASGAIAQTVTITGDTTGGPTWARPFVGGGTSGICSACPYEPQSIQILNSTLFRAEIVASSPGVGSDGFYDTYLHLYQGSFDPSNTSLNLVATDDDGGSGFLLSEISTANGDGPFTPGQYVLVVSGFGNGDFGAYTLQLDGAVLFVANPARGAFGTTVTGLTFSLGEARFGKLGSIAAQGLGARRDAKSTAAVTPSNLIAHKPIITSNGKLANDIHLWGDIGYLAGDIDFADSGSLGYTQIGFDIAIDPDMLIGVAFGIGVLNGGSNGFDADGTAYWVQPYVGFDFGFVRGTLSGTFGVTDYSESTFFGAVAGAESSGGSGHVFLAHDLAFDSGLTVSPYVETTIGNERFTDFTGALAGTPDTNILYLDSALGIELKQEFTFASGGTFTRAGVFGRVEGEYRYAENKFAPAGADDFSGFSAGVALGATATVGENLTFSVEASADGLGGDFESYGGNATVSIGF